MSLVLQFCFIWSLIFLGGLTHFNAAIRCNMFIFCALGFLLNCLFSLQLSLFMSPRKKWPAVCGCWLLGFQLLWTPCFKSFVLSLVFWRTSCYWNASQTAVSCSLSKRACQHFWLTIFNYCKWRLWAWSVGYLKYYIITFRLPGIF